MIYQVSDLTFASDHPFPQLRPAATIPECTFRLQPTTAARREPGSWERHELLPDGRPWLSFGRSGDAYYLRLHGVADFSIDFSTGQVDGQADPDIGDTERANEVVARLFLDKVVPLCLSRRRLVLHASAVGVGSACTAFLGPSGRGKSTLAAYLESQGCPLLSDDYLVLQEAQGPVIAVPSYPKLNLRDDSAAALDRARSAVVGFPFENRRCPVTLHQPDPLPLRRIFTLAPAVGGQVELVPLAGQEAFMELVRNAYCLDPAEGESLRAVFANVAQVAPRVNVVRLSYPREYPRLAEVARRVLKEAESNFEGARDARPQQPPLP